MPRLRHPCRAVVAALGAALALHAAPAGAVPAAVDPVAGGLGTPAAFGGPDGRRALDGPWVRTEAPGATGRARGLPRGLFDGDVVTVPDAANAAPIRGRAGARAFAGSVAWYRTTLRVRATGTYA